MTVSSTAAVATLMAACPRPDLAARPPPRCHTPPPPPSLALAELSLLSCPCSVAGGLISVSCFEPTPGSSRRLRSPSAFGPTQLRSESRRQMCRRHVCPDLCSPLSVLSALRFPPSALRFPPSALRPLCFASLVALVSATDCPQLYALHSLSSSSPLPSLPSAAVQPQHTTPRTAFEAKQSRDRYADCARYTSQLEEEARRMEPLTWLEVRCVVLLPPANRSTLLSHPSRVLAWGDRWSSPCSTASH